MELGSERLFKGCFCLKFRAGFTLVEMLIAVTISIVLVGMGVASYLQFADRLEVRQAGKEFLVTIRGVQKRSQSGEKPPTCPDKLVGWQISRVNETSYRVGALCGGSGLVGEEISVLPGEAKFITSGFSVSFLGLGGGVNGAGNIVLGDMDGKYRYTIGIDSGGGITEIGLEAN